MLALQTDITRIIKETLRERGVDFVDQEFIINLFDATLATFELGTTLEPERLTAVAEQIASDIFNNQHLILQLRQQQAELRTLRNLSLHLSSSLDLGLILHAVVTDAMKLQENSRTAHIFLYDQELDKITFGTALDENGIQEQSFSEPRQNGLTYQVARSGEWIVVPNMRDHPIYVGTPEYWTGSIVGIPLKVEGKVLGVMSTSRADV